MLNLFVEKPTVESGSVPVSWCVDKATLEALAELGAEDLFLLLVVARKGEPIRGSANQDRYVFPFRDLMGFVGFTRPGDYRVFGRIVWKLKEGPDPREELLGRWGFSHWKHELMKNCGFYENWDTGKRQASFDESDFKDLMLSGDGLDLSAELDLSVPAEVFAPEPPAWERAWVNWGHKRPPQDQCEYRKRRVPAYLPFAKPLWFAGVYLFRIIASVIVLGFLPRKFTFRPLTSPLTNQITDFWDTDVGSHLVLPSDKEPHRFFRWAFVPFLPTVLGIMLLVVAIGPGAPYATRAAVALSLLTVASALLALRGLVNWLDWRAQQKHAAAEQAAPPPAVWFIRPEEVQFLACDTAPKPLRYAELPKERRTVRLWFQETKASVCRPFARG